MSADCIFCKIVRGEIPCAKLYETDETLAFLDIGPTRPGHALVIPKAHHETLFELPKPLGGVLLDVMQTVGSALVAATGADGLNVGMNVHEAAGQLVPHAHFHLIPRHEGDGLRHWAQGSYESPEEMARMAEAIRARLG